MKHKIKGRNRRTVRKLYLYMFSDNILQQEFSARQNMYKKKKQDILQHKFFQMLCRELKQYENRGIPLYFGGEAAGAVYIAEQCVIFHPGEYIGQTRRDRNGTVREIWFVPVDSLAFEKNGRWKGGCERMRDWKR